MPVIPGGRPYFFDGAFGTYYASLYGAGRCELENIRFPERVRDVHAEYAAAGADAITANSFGLNPVTVPDCAELEALIAAAMANAFAAAGGRDVFADIGPIPEGTPGDYAATARLCAAHGAKNFIFETQAELAPLLPALDAIKASVPGAFTAVSFAVSREGHTRAGLDCRQLLRACADDPRIDALGLNCVCGPAHLAALTAELLPTLGTAKPFIAMPNSSYPSVRDGRTVYNDNADYFAECLAGMYASGATILGGCCGTTPAHIAAAVALTEGSRNGMAAPAPADVLPAGIRQNAFAARLESGEKLFACELDPPPDADFTKFLRGADELKAAGCDIITVTDSPLARTRADSLAAAAAVHSRTGLPVLPHLTCRDRNHIAVKGGLLCANAMGVDCVLAVTGDPLPEPDRAAGHGVFAMNSYKLISFINEMNGGVFTAAPFLIAGALNVNASVFGAELARAQKKLAYGAKFFLTQPVITDEACENLRLAHETLGCPIFAGVISPASYRNALFLTNEVSGIVIPPELLDALRDAVPEDVFDISASFAADCAAKIAPWCEGYYIMTSLGRTALTALTVRKIREALRKDN